MGEGLRTDGWGRRMVGAALVFGWIVGLGLLFVLWETAGAFLGMGLLVQYGQGAPASATHFYRLSALAACVAGAVHGASGVWPFHRPRRDG